MTPSAHPSKGVADALADAHRREWAFVLAATVRVAGDLDVAEECTQEAYVDALQAWARSGIPERPGAWLTTAARRRAIDRLRREVTLQRKLPLLVEPVEAPEEADGDDDEAVPDDRLRLIFTCCHPALDPAARVALTLRLVCGVTTPDVARAFLVPEPTMAARITRAKKKITHARSPTGRRRAPSSPSASTARSAPCTCCSAPGTRRPRVTSWCATTSATAPSTSPAPWRG